ncbi:uracil-DNA glycosylase [Sulfolobales archaeon HS-7]|nr:uracil-DNA glycosylase [Sulfolobales archaeon HS-7]
MGRLSEMDELRLKITSCTVCRLSLTRVNAVPGDGSINSKIIFIGEAPGYYEDQKGKPFVGAAGKLLTHLISDVLGLERKDVFITNVVKCRPPNNRDPHEDEVSSCSSYLDREIEIISPNYIVTLGRHSTSYILSRANIPFTSISDVRGKFFKWGRIEIMPTFHPAAALYNPQLRSVLEDDFRTLASRLNSKGRNLLDYL